MLANKSRVLLSKNTTVQFEKLKQYILSILEEIYIHDSVCHYINRLSVNLNHLYEQPQL